MKDRNCDKTQYTCAICKTNYDTIQERARCEMSCVKKIEEEERKAAEIKKQEEQAARKAEVDNAYKAFVELAKSYANDYGSYEYEGEPISNALWPNRLWHHFWF